MGSDGMIFTCYPRGNETYTLGLVTGPTTEEAWPELVLTTFIYFKGLTTPVVRNGIRLQPSRTPQIQGTALRLTNSYSFSLLSSTA